MKRKQDKIFRRNAISCLHYTFNHVMKDMTKQLMKWKASKVFFLPWLMAHGKVGRANAIKKWCPYLSPYWCVMNRRNVESFNNLHCPFLKNYG